MGAMVDFDKLRDKQIKAAKRAQEKQRAKLNDPVWLEKQFAKKKEQQQRQQARQKAKQLELRSKPPATKAKPAKKTKSSRGMKGRTPNALEKRIMDKIGKLPCVCCQFSGRINHNISLHHVDGRVKPLAHAKVLPLCQYHHDTPLSKEEMAKYPDIVPVHAKGSVGGKAAFEKLYGTQESLLEKVYSAIEMHRPWLSLETSEHLF